MSWTLQDLIDAALSVGVVESKDLDEVEWFCFEYELMPAEERVEASIIYHAYVSWKISKDEDNILSEKGFFTKFRLRFKRQISTGQRYYHVKSSKLDRGINNKIAVRRLRNEAKEWYQERKKRRLSRSGTL